MSPQKISVIISTYNEPRWLEKVLWGYEKQTFTDFEIIVADDGSTEETISLLRKFQEKGNLKIIHQWHEDQGYQKCAIVNKAIAGSKADYLIFTDGDCIPRKDFVEQHVKNAKQGFFLSGGAIRLPIELSEKINQQDIETGRAFNRDWLIENGLPANFKSTKLIRSSIFTQIMNRITPANASWNGGNSSGWRTDILAVNGYDERMEYGGQDRELGERLMNNGIKPKQLRYTAICIHLEHKRGYKNQKSIDKNKGIRRETKTFNTTWTNYGIIKAGQ